MNLYNRTSNSQIIFNIAISLRMTEKSFKSHHPHLLAVKGLDHLLTVPA